MNQPQEAAIRIEYSSGQRPVTDVAEINDTLKTVDAQVWPRSVQRAGSRARTAPAARLEQRWRESTNLMTRLVTTPTPLSRPSSPIRFSVAEAKPAAQSIRTWMGSLWKIG
jgi:hypothetical protein